MCFLHLGKIPEIGGQIMKEFLIDNHVDVGKFKSFTPNYFATKHYTSLKTTRNLQEFKEKSLD